MTSAEKIDLLDKTLNRILGAIGSADAKVAQLFAISTGMLGFEATIVTHIKPFIWLDYLAVVTSVLLLLFCVFSLSMVLYPRLSGPPTSVLYFLKIAMNDGDCYKNRIDGLTDDALFDDYARQCHRNAEIARDKFFWLRKANIALFVATIPWLSVVLIGYA
ncbi:Pycsar system effector family protein [Acidithiobacillus ferrooxidans]|uniref:Pycsar system effector family protein n=1 Tax=Acidithiobacillus ferrooxidans TaxID=920 RepID=UPI0013D6E540|nr:Pycsar system effector family protein [Acidithiobacillus ferrooxidans]